jgi:ABC-type amino acid transport substrate-binding protein
LKPRSTLLLVGLALLTAMPSAAQPSPTLRLASDVWPPFTDVLGNTRIAVDLVTEALGHSDQDVKIIIREDFGKLMEGIISGTYDGSAALWHSTEREAFLFFSRPYLENRLVLVGRKGADVSATDLASLAGRQIAIVGDYAYNLTEGDNEAPEWISGQSDQENLQALLKGAYDYVLADAFLIQHVLERYGAKAEEALQVSPDPLLTRTLHFAVRKDFPNAVDIITQFDKAIRQMVSDGSYNEILQLNWIRADVDGDGLVELVMGSAYTGPDAPDSSYDVLTTDKSTGGAYSRYWIDGKLYSSWNEVPDQYKAVPTKGSTSSLTGGGMLDLDF